MNILFLTLSKINDLSASDLYTDMVTCLRDKGHNVYVVRPVEKREKDPAGITVKDGITILKVRTGNITKNKSFIEKGISTLKIEGQYKRAIINEFEGIHFDLILYATPPITFNNLITWIKKRDNANTYLILRDIFPQNAIDMGLFTRRSVIYKFFKLKEAALYSISDYIGTLSQANKEYILNNENLDKEKVEIFPNSIKVEKNFKLVNKDRIYQGVGLNPELQTFIYGGNIGVPQDWQFISKICGKLNKINGWQTLIIGSGSRYEKLSESISNYKNVKIVPSLPSHQYEELLSVCDIGMVFLSKKFTIPNYPSRILSYCKYSKPIIALTDKATDVRELIQQNKMGLWFESDESRIDNIISEIKQWLGSKEYEVAGKNSYKILCRDFNMEKNIDIILNHFQKGE